MERNVGTIDKIIRVVIGLVLISLGYYYSTWWLYLIAALVLFTAATAHCLPYTWLGINTAKKVKKKTKKKKK